jgi:hypothetical protein
MNDRLEEGQAMSNIQLIILVFGFVFACLATYGIGAPRWHLGWAALACLLLALIFGGGAHLLGVR